MTAAEILKRPYARVVVPEEDGSFRAEIMEFPGCIASGDTVVDAYSALERVAESWIEATQAKRQAIPDPVESQEFSGKLVLRLPKSLHRQAAWAARRDAVSLNQFIVGAVAEQVGVRSVATASSRTIMNNLVLGPSLHFYSAVQTAAGMGTLATQPMQIERVT